MEENRKVFSQPLAQRHNPPSAWSLSILEQNAQRRIAKLYFLQGSPDALTTCCVKCAHLENSKVSNEPSSGPFKRSSSLPGWPVGGNKQENNDRDIQSG